MSINETQYFPSEFKAPFKSENENVVAVISDNKPAPHVEDVLISEASKLGMPTYQISNWSTVETQDLFASLKSDLCVMAFVEAYIPKKILDTPWIGCIQFHPSLCPLYRGPSAMSWAIANGEKFTGCTIHFVNKFLDSGKIIVQKKVRVRKNDDPKSIKKKVLKMEHEIYPQAIFDVLSNL